jgi:hypothetical protein
LQSSPYVEAAPCTGGCAADSHLDGCAASVLSVAQLTAQRCIPIDSEQHEVPKVAYN